MNLNIHKADGRGHVRLHWLNSFHSFSFGSYYNPKKMGFGTLRVINHDVIAPNSGFGMHPHANMEIITIVLQGTLSHTDSLGNTGTITAGEVQVMSAGRGIFHAEENLSSTEEVELLQIWITPKNIGGSPLYNQQSYSNTEDNNWKLLVSPEDSSQKEILQIRQNAYITRKKSMRGEDVCYTPHNIQNGIYLLVLSGSIRFADHILSCFDALSIFPSGSLDFFVDTDAEVIVFEVPMQ